MEDASVLLDRVVAFAQADDRVSAVVQTGSRARGRRVDEFSDLDIELLGPGVAGLAGDDSWLDAFGDVLVAIHLDNDDDEPGWPTCLAVFSQGRKIDFTLAGDDRLSDMLDKGLTELYERGYIVHVDKNGLAARLPQASLAPPTHAAPSAEAFETNIREFWFEATQVPIYIRRGDLWPVKLRDGEMKNLLLQMMEWYAHAASQGDVDTWHNGHHLHEWLPGRYYDRLRQCFGTFDDGDSLRALVETVDLYADISFETATRSSSR